MGMENVKHDTVGRTVAMSKGHLHCIVYDALRRLQTTPQIINGSSPTPVLRTSPESSGLH
jgi:hypothetical protein